MIKLKGLLLLMVVAMFSANLAAQGTLEQVTFTHPDIDSPIVFNVALPANYANNTDKHYPLMLDFHYYAHTYLQGMHDWLSHNGEWPWPQTIIVTPQAGNRVGMLFDPKGNTTPLLDFFETTLIPYIDEHYRTTDYRIMSGFRVNGSVVLSALINKPGLFDAHIAISPELKDDYVQIVSSSAEKLQSHGDQAQFLLFTHGESEKETSQQADYAAFLKVLENSAPENITWHYENYADHYFMSLPLLSVIRGIELLHQANASDELE